jgi:hypothetical protein
MEYVVMAACDEIVASGRQPANKQVEHGSALHTLIVIRLQHGEFVQVRQKRRVVVIYPMRGHVD